MSERIEPSLQIGRQEMALSRMICAASCTVVSGAMLKGSRVMMSLSRLVISASPRSAEKMGLRSRSARSRSKKLANAGKASR